jgi:hypothetical protein
MDAFASYYEPQLHTMNDFCLLMHSGLARAPSASDCQWQLRTFQFMSYYASVLQVVFRPGAEG